MVPPKDSHTDVGGPQGMGEVMLAGWVEYEGIPKGGDAQAWAWQMRRVENTGKRGGRRFNPELSTRGAADRAGG